MSIATWLEGNKKRKARDFFDLTGDASAPSSIDKVMNKDIVQVASEGGTIHKVKHRVMPSMRSSSGFSSKRPSLSVTSPSTSTPAGAIGTLSNLPPPKPDKIPMKEPTLSAGQKRVLDTIMAGENIFFTGAAGSGKSFILRYAVEKLKDIKGNNSVYVTASTGIAACNIGAITLHSFAGCGVGDHLNKELCLQSVKRSKKNSLKWTKCEVLIIDEISMIDGNFFDILDYVARKVRPVRHSNLPFGGIQLILVGDFLQLPPVCLKDGGRFCFESEAWAAAVPNCINLKQIFRQKDDTFVNLLNEVRVGQISPGNIQILENIMKKSVTQRRSGDIEPTRLYSTNINVDSLNDRRLDECNGDSKTYTAHYVGTDAAVAQLKKSCRWREHLTLKVAAQVMLLTNYDTEGGLVNGTKGVVTGFGTTGETGREEAFPIVKFTLADGDQREVTLVTDKYTIESAGVIVATMHQVPLSLSWAATIHKAQGMTISCLEVSLAECFEYGQVYVALSRATSLDTLYIRSFDPRKIKAHPKVLEFYKKMIDNGSPTGSAVKKMKVEDDNDGWLCTTALRESNGKSVGKEAVDPLKVYLSEEQRKDIARKRAIAMERLKGSSLSARNF